MSETNEKRDLLLQRIGEALVGIRQEIAKSESGKEALDGSRQLMFMESKLIEMTQVLQQEDWRCIQRTKPGMARLVVDTWPMHEPLGDLISEIEYSYGRLK
ncbi:MAG: hypothetical protein ACYDC1_09845 [Limisphaerales bacterium]